ncbi:MAG: DNA recombination protein RmuC [Alphaproteobacteria bacterium]|nr:DNA recombination protein RmuC [Alphaproteobacteria bacterium]
MISVNLLIAVACFCAAVIVFQTIAVYNLNNKNSSLLLEKIRLEERCSCLEPFEKKYEDLFANYSELEKKNILLQSNLEQEKKNLAEKISLLQNAEEKLSNTFKALSSDALSKNNRSFLDLAQATFSQLQEKAKSDLELNRKSVGDLVNPIKSALDGVGQKLGDLEKSRVGAYEALKQQVGDLIVSQNSLKNETSRLVSALKTPTTRGRWGEIQLRRVVELSGMIEHCDFQEQMSATNQDTKIRPDMIIYYPGNKQVVVDSKVPLTAYLKSLEVSNDIEKKILLKEHAKQLRDHVMKLSKKEYWAQFQDSPEFVIMFLPGEIFFSVAIEQDPELIEFAMREKVLIATPTTLLALLHTIAWGWRQENLAENAKQIVKMGQELYKRLCDMSQHFANLGRSVSNVVVHYNRTVASLESRVLVSARKFKEIENHEKNIVELSGIDDSVRQISDKS